MPFASVDDAVVGAGLGRAVARCADCRGGVSLLVAGRARSAYGLRRDRHIGAVIHGEDHHRGPEGHHSEQRDREQRAELLIAGTEHDGGVLG